MRNYALLFISLPPSHIICFSRQIKQVTTIPIYNHSPSAAHALMFIDPRFERRPMHISQYANLTHLQRADLSNSCLSLYSNSSHILQCISQPPIISQQLHYFIKAKITWILHRHEPLIWWSNLWDLLWRESRCKIWECLCWISFE